MAGERVKVGVDGLRELKGLLNVDSILGAEWKRAMEAARDYAAERFRARMPTDTGAGVSTIRPQIQSRAVPTWARVKFDVKARPNPNAGARGSVNPQNPFRVMGALEGGARYHYSRGGGPTKGWWSTAIQESHNHAREIIGRAAKDIEKRWSAWRGVIWIKKHT